MVMTGELKDISGNVHAPDDAAELLERLGCDILRLCRDELYFSMRFLDVALSSFMYRMDAGVSPFGTDGRTIYFHPQQLGGLYRTNRILANRGISSHGLHCIFRHIVKGFRLKRKGRRDNGGASLESEL